MQDTNDDCARKCEAVRTVSVAIVAHNEAQHFSNILEDVVAQDFPHNRIELLLIDSMSKDDTKQVMLEFAESDQAKGFQRVAVLSNPGEILPCGYDAYLRMAFGDYMQLPPEDKRKPHHDAEFFDLNTPCARYKGVKYCVEEPNRQSNDER